MNDSRDRVMDSLLTQHLGETPASMESRYARAFAGLDALDPGAAVPAGRTSSRTRLRRFAQAALIALFLGLSLLLLPFRTNASTVLSHAASSESRSWRDGGERRYEVEVRFMRFTPAGEKEVTLRGNWDLRGPECRLELASDQGPSLIRADSSDGAWGQRGKGPVRTLETRELWPHWIEDRNGYIAFERMDELLHLVQRAYDVAPAQDSEEPPAALRGATHLVASRRDAVAGPDAIDLWIDAARGVVIEAQLNWAKRPAEAKPARPLRGQPPPPDASPEAEYRMAPGALPAQPPLELRLRRVEPISFPDDHFRRLR